MLPSLNTIEQNIKHTQIFENEITFQKVLINEDKKVNICDYYQYFNIFTPDNIKKSCLKRQHEFLIGRISANYALKALGFDHHFILHIGQYGEPIWPKNIIGSISHTMYSATEGVAIAYASYDRKIVGIDIEIKNNNEIFLNQKISLTHFLTKNELNYIHFFQQYNNFIYLILFSAKESVIKAIYNYYHFVLNFTSIHCININMKNSTITFYIPKLTIHKKIIVHFVNFKNEILTYCISD